MPHTRNIARFALLSAVSLSGLILMACMHDEPAAAKAVPKKAEPASTASANPADAKIPTPRLVSNTEVAPEGGSPVMNAPLDGSSVEAFEKGLAVVNEQATAFEAQQLNSALKYLQMYDLSLRGDKAKLYAKVSGKTPNQVIDQANNR
jgi:hypothetical protein